MLHCRAFCRSRSVSHIDTSLAVQGKPTPTIHEPRSLDLPLSSPQPSASPAACGLAHHASFHAASTMEDDEGMRFRNA